MKKLIILIIVVFALFGCMLSSPDFDNAKCMETVVNEYPGSVVFAIPDRKYRFIVIENNNTVRYVTVLGEYTEIDTNLIIKKGEIK